eukprot:g1133.t1
MFIAGETEKSLVLLESAAVAFPRLQLPLPRALLVAPPSSHSPSSHSPSSHSPSSHSPSSHSPSSHSPSSHSPSSHSADDEKKYFKKYSLNTTENRQGGACGEVWRATSRIDGERYILKRIFTNRGESVRLSGLREAHFGMVTKDLDNVARFIEYFILGTDELWLVFKDEGLSLNRIMYTSRAVSGGSVFMVHSEHWPTLRRMRNLRRIAKGMLRGLMLVHQRNVTHRDVKPSNVIVSKDEHGSHEIRLADFGSAVDPFSAATLYGAAGPTLDELSLGYAPPEVTIYGILQPDFTYDIWSCGLTLLEIYLGTDKPFQLASRDRALLLKSKQRKTKEELALAGYAQFCIFASKSFGIRDEGDCDFRTSLKERDPLSSPRTHYGKDFDLFADLLAKMLSWPPTLRPTAETALQHAFFERPKAVSDELLTSAARKVVTPTRKQRRQKVEGEDSTSETASASSSSSSSSSSEWKLPVFARIRPPRANVELATRVVVAEEKKTLGSNQGKKELELSTLGNSHHRHFEKFKFDCFKNIFDASASNSEIYEDAVADIVDGVLHGFNGTIFAYGQTGSGKTWTITGGTSYEERGIIPLSLSSLFQTIANANCKVLVSFLEIYNESMYDLLDSRNRNKPIEQWEKVQLLDDKRGDLQVRGLRVYDCKSEKDALNMLFLGNMNRMTSETPMNLASSRSHCIFTLTLEMQGRRSKLHLVDLAGSERVYRVAKDEPTAREGRGINLSLHYLENVIIALQEQIAQPKQHIHVPYRNSMLTSVLRDSLGGNCRTIFIATLNPEGEFVGESLSTCRFAQRVSAIKQVVAVNKKLDLKSVVRQLESEQHRLIARLREATEWSKEKAAEPTEEQKESIRRRVAAYISKSSQEHFKCSTESEATHAIAFLRISVLEAQKLAEERGATIAKLQQELTEARKLLHDAQQLEEGTKGRSEGGGGQDIESLRVMVDELRSELLVTRQNADDSVALATEQASELRKAIDVSHKKLEQSITDRVEEMQRSHMVTSPPAAAPKQIEEDNDDAVRLRSMLQRGAVFLKHNKFGNPHPRFVWISADASMVMWRKVGDRQGSSSSSIPVSTILSVRSGRETPRFRRDTSGLRQRPHCHSASFSIIFSSRTLDLEVDCHGIDDASVAKMRDTWVAAFRNICDLARVQGTAHSRSATSLN